MDSSGFRLWVNISLRASFTDSAAQFLLYLMTVNHSNVFICKQSIVNDSGSSVTSMNVIV